MYRICCQFLCLLSVIATPSFAQTSATPKIVIVGDSTAADDTGWGAGFSQSLKNGAEYDNHAAAGRSSKSFRDEGRWQRVLYQKPTVVLIQFGLFDHPGKGAERATDPKTSFRETLTLYIQEARLSGATPVLITPMSRRIWQADGKTIRHELDEYAEAVIAVGKDHNVPVIDLYALTIQVYESVGKDTCEAFGPVQKNGKSNEMHLNQAGSKLIGNLVTRELKTALPEFAQYLK